MRDFKRADEAFKMDISLDPKQSWPYIAVSFNQLSWKGVTKESMAAYTNADKNDGWYSFMEFWNTSGTGNYERALQLVSDTTKEWVVNTPVFASPQSLYRAYIYQHLGKTRLAEKNFQAAMHFMEQRVKEVPNDFRYHSTLAITYAALGKKQEAITEINKALYLLPLEKDAMYGTSPMFEAIVVYLFNGDTEKALDQLELMLSFSNPYTLRYLDWYLPLQALKEHPGYAELKKKYPTAD